MSEKYTYEFVKNYFEEQGCELLSTDYKKTIQKLDYVCSCGNQAKINFNDFRKGRRCRKCQGKRTNITKKERNCLGPKIKYSGEFVKNYFVQNNCILLTPIEEYKKVNQTINYICSCGNKSKTTFSKFLAGKRCWNCRCDRINSANKNNHNGILWHQTEEFKENMKKYYLEKYGVDWYTKTKEYVEKSKKSCLKRYGVEFVSQIPGVGQKRIETYFRKHGVKNWKKNPDAFAKFQKRMIEKYGISHPPLNFEAGVSKASRNFFAELYEMIPLEFRNNCHFSPLTFEYSTISNGKFYKYDFVQTQLKKVVEFNGIKFHPKPEQEDSEIGWHLFKKNRTVKEARKYEEKKIKALTDLGFEVLVIWDTEVKNILEKQKSLQKAFNFLFSS